MTTATTQVSLLLKSKRAIISMAVIVFFFAAGLSAPFSPLPDPNKQNLNAIGLPPFWVEGGDLAHPLGTDSLGRDILSRLVHGASVALYVAVAATTLTAIIGIVLGITAGYFRGKVDDLLMRIVDIWMSFPPIILAIVLISVLGVDLNNVVLAVALVDWTRFTRVLRSEVLSIREKDFVTAAQTIGFSPNYIMWREIFPNILPTFIIIAALEMGIAISVEVLLSFVGLGVRPTTPSWGTMLADGLNYFRTNPYGVIFPLSATIAVILSLNIFGEVLREKIDPRLMVIR